MTQCLPVLVVDDSEICLTGVSLLLARHGIATKLAKGTKAALSTLECSNFSAILMDYQMIGATGAQCASEIRSRESGSGCRIPIIGLTSHDDAAVRSDCLLAGMDAVLSKDVEEDVLIAVLNSFIKSD
ncbi:MAG: response regulator [Candidatus Obscuribacter sp.]|nr:response regulator [Candidatus Melainabacteria bacterium]MDX1989606.1 response regulator [Candidatus Obscuribacter sp.]